MLNILIAPNSFKNSLTAEQAAQAIETGLLQSGLKGTFKTFPIADGGDHTAHLICKHLDGRLERLIVSGAYLDPTTATYGLINQGETAIIEVAETSGFKSIKEGLKSPLQSSTQGLGELIKQGIDQKIADFIICLGGSATVDGGIGMLQALGLKCYDQIGKQIWATPANFDQVEQLDPSELIERTRNVTFTVLCDVENTLLGPDGAAQVFGPQKGASEQEVRRLEEFLTHFNDLTQRLVHQPLNEVIGGGAAGGLGAAFSVYLNARMEKGAQYFCELTGFHQALAQADLLITGEGSIDHQSLAGKAPIVVAGLARDRNLPVLGLAGKIPRTISEDLQQYFSMLLSIGNQPEELDLALSHTAENLTRTAKQIASLLMALQN